MSSPSIDRRRAGLLRRLSGLLRHLRRLGEIRNPFRCDDPHRFIDGNAADSMHPIDPAIAVEPRLFFGAKVAQVGGSVRLQKRLEWDHSLLAVGVAYGLRI